TNGADTAGSFPASDPAAPTSDNESGCKSTEHLYVLGLASNPVAQTGLGFDLVHSIASIASITSCTNTSNPSVMMAAGLLARNAADRGLSSKPWVKTSMAPGSQVVTNYYTKAGLWPALEELGFHLVGYGCTTCIGNSGP